ncbi:MAG: response regulator [Magnetococcales bacterium]|nr:response regulator [Magnetococcales bacterium]
MEDDHEAANELRDTLRSLGHDCVIVPSQEEAMALLDAGKFCFVLLDLQILTAPDAFKPILDAGKILLKDIRSHYPARNQDDQHLLQIIVMSGYAKETPDAVQCLKDGADDFIAKPLDPRSSAMARMIEESLKKSGRTNHLDCPVVMELARGDHAVIKGTLDTVRPFGVQLSITGETQWKRTGASIGGKAFSLPDSQFLLLMNLVANRVRNVHGWTHKKVLGSNDEEGFKGISNLNSVIKPHLPDGIHFYENDNQGNYRINPDIMIGKIDYDRLENHRLKSVAQLSTEIRRMR